MLSASQRRLLWIGLLLVLAVAAWMRLWQLAHFPPGLFGDEAADALDALDVLAGRGQVFFPSNFGREGLHMWILAGMFRLMGVTPYAIRLPSALAGIVTALAAYWLGYELFIARLEAWDDRSFRRAWLIALAAGMFTATSYWHVHFSRFGIRGVFTTMMAGLTMAALWRAVRLTERDLGWRAYGWWVVAGALMGIGAHFYTASRFIPLFVGLFLAGWLGLSLIGAGLRPQVKQRRGFVVGSVLMFAVAGLIFAPLGYYFLTHPGSFTQRAGEVSAFKDGFSWATARVIGRAAALNLLQFVWPGHGDMARFYNLPGRAVFSIPMAWLALLGMGISLKGWRRPEYAFLLLWFLIMASPSFLAVDRAPTLPRVLGVIPGVFFFPAIGLAVGLDWLVDRVSSLSPRGRAMLFWGLAVVALVWPGVLTYRDYFLVWGPAPETADAFEVDMTTLWRWLEEHPQDGMVFVSADLYKHPTFMALYEQVPTTEYFTRQDPQIHWFDARRAWPLPREGESATILVGNSAMPPEWVQELMGITLTPIGDGAAYLATMDFSVSYEVAVWFSDKLGLMEQVVLPPGEGHPAALVQFWHTRGPDISMVAPYQIQSALLGAEGQQVVQVSDEMGMRAPEWEPDGGFVTWQEVSWPAESTLTGTALRVVPFDQPPLKPSGSVDGWVQRAWVTWAMLFGER